MDTKVVHFKKEKYDVYIGRPSKWGNPFKIGRDGSRIEVIHKFEKWIMKEIKDQPFLYEEMKRELKGKIIGCWCSPQPCHGDILAWLVDEHRHILGKPHHHQLGET